MLRGSVCAGTRREKEEALEEVKKLKRILTEVGEASQVCDLPIVCYLAGVSSTYLLVSKSIREIYLPLGLSDPTAGIYLPTFGFMQLITKRGSARSCKKRDHDLYCCGKARRRVVRAWGPLQKEKSEEERWRAEATGERERERERHSAELKAAQAQAAHAKEEARRCQLDVERMRDQVCCSLLPLELSV